MWWVGYFRRSRSTDCTYDLINHQFFFLPNFFISSRSLNNWHSAWLSITHGSGSMNLSLIFNLFTKSVFRHSARKSFVSSSMHSFAKELNSFSSIDLTSSLITLKEILPKNSMLVSLASARVHSIRLQWFHYSEILQILSILSKQRESNYY